MKVRRFVRVVPLSFALALGVSGTVGAVTAPVSQATVLHAAAMGELTKTGTFDKLLSSTSFKMSVAMKPYIVETNGMTHISLDSMHAKLSAFKKGDTVTVKGVLHMGTILATTVVSGM
jgi:hypothetical protein